MKQTAVEWLMNEICNIDEGIQLTKKTSKKILNLFEQAKEMEKEQIIEAHGNKQKTKSNPDSIVTYGYTFTGEMYYNETFKK